MTGRRGTPEERLWRRVNIGAPDECWEWQGARHSFGYGRVGLGGNRCTAAHRVAYASQYGPIPDGLVIDHLCRNPPCCNPAHLEAVTHRENTLRGTTRAAQNARKTHCHRGHPFDETNTYINPRGQRNCRACAFENQRKRRARLRGEQFQEAA